MHVFQAWSMWSCSSILIYCGAEVRCLWWFDRWHWGSWSFGGCSDRITTSVTHEETPKIVLLTKQSGHLLKFNMNQIMPKHQCLILYISQKSAALLYKTIRWPLLLRWQGTSDRRSFWRRILSALQSLHQSGHVHTHVPRTLYCSKNCVAMKVKYIQ